VLTTSISTLKPLTLKTLSIQWQGQFFKSRHYAVDPNISQSKKKRSQERSLQISNSASSLTACLAFSKPPKIQIYILINRCYSRSEKEFAGVGLLGSELECQDFF
jgi:hypothetical protein